MASHETFMPQSLDWHTPPEIIEAFPEFDMDPCCGENQTTITAKRMIRYPSNGLAIEWEGSIWLNPPWGAGYINHWLERMAKHNNGIALVPARLDVTWFHAWVFPFALSLFVFRGRLTFVLPYAANARLAAKGNCACPCVLVSYGDTCTRWLREANQLRGVWLPLAPEMRIEDEPLLNGA